MTNTNKFLIKALWAPVSVATLSTSLTVLFIVVGPPLIWLTPAAAIAAAGAWYLVYLEYKRWKKLLVSLENAVKRILEKVESGELL